MILRFIFIALLLLSSPVAGQTRVPVTSGDHATFARLVFIAPKDLAYDVRTERRKLRLTFEDFDVDFDLSAVFKRLPKTRILNVVQRNLSGGRAGLDIDLACACEVTVERLNNYLIIDVMSENDTRFGEARSKRLNLNESIQNATAETRPKPRSASIWPRSPLLSPPISPEVTNPDKMDPRRAAYAPSETNQNARKKEPVSQIEEARRSLVRQLERAAEQGLVALSNPKPAKEPMDDQIETDLELELEALSVELDALGSVRLQQPNEPGPTDLPEIMAEDTPVVSHCLPDSHLDPENWADERAFNAQLAELRMDLLGEFDRPDTEALEKLVKFYLHFGLASEANQLLKSYPVPFDGRDILVEITTVLDDKKVEDAAIFGTSDCGDRAGLWRALSFGTLDIVDREAEDSILAAYGELPIMLRDVLAVKLIDRMIENNRLDTAETLLSINQRNARTIDYELKLQKARLASRQGDDQAATQLFSELVTQNAPNYYEALVELGDIFLKRGSNIPAEYVQDLQVAATENRDTLIGQDLFQTLLKAQVQMRQLPAALSDLRRYGAEVLREQSKIAQTATDLFALALEFPPEATQLAKSALDHSDMMAGDAREEDVKTKLSQSFLDMGLPNYALDLLERSNRSDQNRIISGQALLLTGLSDEVDQELGGLDTAQTRVMRAQALADMGEFEAALLALNEDDDPVLYAQLAWLQGQITPETTENVQSEERKVLGGLARGTISESDADSELGFPGLARVSKVTLDEVRSVLDETDEVLEATKDVLE